MDVAPQFESRTVAQDPDAAKSLYVAQLDLPKPGRYDVIGLTRLDNRLVAATPAGGPLVVTKDDPVPDVGETAPTASTETEADVQGDLEKLDTRKVGDGGGTEHEEIEVHLIAREDIPAFVAERRVAGVAIDVKLLIFMNF